MAKGGYINDGREWQGKSGQVYPTFWLTIIQSPQWQEWRDVSHDHGFDGWECEYCGWISDKHFQAFLEFTNKKK